MHDQQSGFQALRERKAFGPRVMVMLSLALLLQVLHAGPLLAHEMTSASVKLHAAAMSGGGAIDPLASAAQYLDTTIGQSSPVTSSPGRAGGIQVSRSKRN